ncbi:ATP-grasp domain-containing protein [Aliiglaciecola lipolytica]|uniref:Prokaryotic glutathione synthetase ATP-binding domain-containing protein n=1 Tax=Aliiglaciecola lipolytica E3 TaxID=1127673 RepID=K6YW69_9ALTE|nr:hypothetical protein [Aliiglaciecola lipolytica]GAC15495.1 hypothetical protein GLIP_2874 [Aliiglaciecola lipolytica E3]
MRKLAILSTDDLEDFFVYDHLAYEPLLKLGWQADEVSWHADNIDWNDYEVVVIRSTWDYQSKADEFVEVLEKIHSSTAKLENSLALVKWNINKDYLRDLNDKGVGIVPTKWCYTFDFEEIKGAFEYFGCREIVIKPLVSANADYTYRLTLDAVLAEEQGLSEVFSTRGYMIQPFIKSVVNEGEYSLFYFNGKFSHCIVKVPKHNDFRVQEEHGGQLRSVEAEEPLLETANEVVAALPELPLYARIDLVKYKDRYVTMEVELIEPSLYFNMDASSAERFAQEFVSRYGLGK